MDLLLGTDVAMTFTCHSCGTVNSVLRLNGSPKVFACTGCKAGYRILVERIREPEHLKRMVKASEYIVGTGQ
jgi:transcription elongation factor Elf1